eukprot:9324195-Pyramimonas_sp.AAC.1
MRAPPDVAMATAAIHRHGHPEAEERRPRAGATSTTLPMLGATTQRPSPPMGCRPRARMGCRHRGQQLPARGATTTHRRRVRRNLQHDRAHPPGRDRE